MSFERTKTIRGRQYRYRQTSVREGKRVRSIMEYLGPVDGHRPGLASAERHAKQVDAYQRAKFGETGEERAARDKASQFDQDAFLAETADEKGDPSSPA